ncbi:Vps54-domain-containing protein [Aureobasidium pullulans]|uniref:Vacuolar protein sorting-associated protein 54 n=1 Tax=Aureobasidium pullulans TaxID=5580 RepID=A0A4S9M0R7_AURPU|nr:Vps54-domain-containing protein [Aureobasidium pullulans]
MSEDSADLLDSPSSLHSAYPFPSSYQRRPSRRLSNDSTISINSVGGSLDINAQRGSHSLREAGQNAISTLLQPPIIRTGLLTPAASTSSTYRAPTTRDIPPVTLSNIPKVDPSAFKHYISRLGPLFDNLNRLRRDTKSTQQIHLPASPVLSRHNSAASLLSPTDSPQPTRRSSAYARRRLNEPTPLSTIPSVYFDENFQLENPRTFDVVSERAEIAPGTAKQEQSANGLPLPPRKALASNAILQEKLSWYMDTVEVHLIQSISSASTSFFAALGSLRDLEQEASDSVTRIQKLRADLAKLDQDMAMGGLHVANLRRRYQNMQKLANAVDQVARVVQDAKDCEELVEKGEYDAAASAMLRLDRLIAGQPNLSSDAPAAELHDLRSLHALQGLSDSMNQLRFRIGRGFESRFLETLLSDLRRHIDHVPPKDTMRRWASTSMRLRGLQSGPTAYMEIDEQFRKDLLASLHGLSNSGQTAQATADFREAIMREMKHLIRKHLPSSNDDDNESVTSVATRTSKAASQQEKSIILARNLRAMDEETAEDMVVNIYTDISEALRRLSIQIKVLLDVTSTMDAPDSLKSPLSPSVRPADRSRSPAPRISGIQEELSQALDMSSLLGQAVDVAHTQVTRILKVRTEQVNQLPLERFLRYFTINRLFADECEAISGRSGTQLKALVNTQINTFVRAFGDAENQRIAQTLDSDQWEAKDFKEPDQALLSRILEGMSSDPAVWLQGTRVWEDPSQPESTNGTPASNGENNDTKPANRPAYVDETRYILVSSAISLLRPIDNFLALMASIPSITSAAVPALIDVLRTFNSRTSQLILGAGATRIAGLKNITTKHLALASQALSFVIAMSPYLRESVRRHASSANKGEVLGEFDKLKRLYQDHQMAIHDKLVEIMTARATSHVNAMKKLDFDAEAKKNADGTSAYMETLTKETGTLHRVLSRHLADMDVTVILSQIFSSYKEQWLKAFQGVEIKTAAGKQRLLKDAQLFDSKLSKIDGFGDMGKTLIDAVSAKTVVQEKAVVSPPPPPSKDADSKTVEVAKEKPLPVTPEPVEKESEKTTTEHQEEDDAKT